MSFNQALIFVGCFLVAVFYLAWSKRKLVGEYNKLFDRNKELEAQLAKLTKPEVKE
jgi:cell division protein FtsB